MRLACLQPAAPGVPDLVRCVLVPAPGVHSMARSHFSDNEYHNLWGSLQAGETHVCSRQASRAGAGPGVVRRCRPPPRGPLRRPAEGAMPSAATRWLTTAARPPSPPAVRVQAGAGQPVVLLQLRPGARVRPELHAGAAPRFPPPARLPPPWFAAAAVCRPGPCCPRLRDALLSAILPLLAGDECTMQTYAPACNACTHRPTSPAAPASPLLPLKPPPPTLPLPAAHLLRQPPRHLPPVQARLPPHRGGHGRPGQVGAGAVPHSSFSAGVLPTWWAGSDVCMAGLDESRGHTLQGLLSLCAVRERLDALGSVPLQLGWCPAGSGAGFASFGSHAAAGSASCGSQLARPAL